MANIDLSKQQIARAQDALRQSCKWFPVDEDCQRCSCECPIDYGVRHLDRLASEVRGEVPRA